MSIMEITGLSHSFGDHVLYKSTNFVLNKGEHVGVVGQNGAGKSTFIKICTGQVVPDDGRVIWQPNISIGYLDQYAALNPNLTMQTFLRTAFASLYEIEMQMNALYEKAGQGDTDGLMEAGQYQELLEMKGFYSIEEMIERVTRGLGLEALGLERPIKDMSGGQRAKVILAKLLLEKPEVLLLDEPTNFLDKEHVSWLAEYLSALDQSFLVVSHDVAFLERVTNCICDIDNQTINKYSGSYRAFLKKKAQRRENYIRQYVAQQKEIKKTEAFIRKNIAGRHSKMARGRQKQLDRMERMEALSIKEQPPTFRFNALPTTNALHLSVKQLTVGYQFPVLKGLSFAVSGGQKVVVTGFNGIGKSTLLKTLVGQLSALDGYFRFSDQVKLGYFEQEINWAYPEQTPIQVVREKYPALPTKTIRQHLAQCGISSAHAMQAIGTLSGGEQAKVRLCLLTLTPCNFLILDEPTNHLDGLAKNALQEALYHFTGTVLLVSHEAAFYKDWIDKVIDIERS